MRQFKDNAGRAWTVAINVAAVKRVKSLVGVNLLDAAGGELVERLIGDPVMLVDVLYSLCQPEAQQKNVSDEQFGEAMAGDAINLATAAMLEELSDFFPNPRDRERSKRVLRMIEKMTAKAQDVMDAKLTEMEPEIERMMLSALESAPSASATSSAGSSGLTPAR